MSRFLKHKKTIAILFLIALFELGLLLIFKKSLLVFVICIFDLVLSVLLFLTIKAHKYMRSQMSVFGAKSKVRNADCLLIGELCDPQKVILDTSKSFVQIKVPDVSEFAAFQILKRTHSILNENGSVYIVLKNQNLNKRTISIIDTYFFHEITIKEFKLQKKYNYRKLLFFIHPIRTIRAMLGKSNKVFSEFKGQSVMKDFCAQRNIELHVLVD